MLKWFRKYNKILLVVFGCVLMVVFLLPQGFSMFQGGRSSYAVFTLKDGSKVTFGDQDRARAVLDILASLAQPLLFQPGADQPFQRPEPAHWALMLHEARAMGIQGSEVEVDQLIAALGLAEDPNALAQRAALMGQTVDAVREALRDWVTVQRYRETMLGLAHLTIEQRLNQLASAMQYVNFYMQIDAGNPMLGELIRTTLEPVAGAPRISAPLLERVVTEAESQVTIDGLLVRSDRYLDEVPEPSEADMRALYDAYRDQPEGAASTSPHGFGYRIPDRVKIEYLVFDAAKVRQSVTIDDLDAVAYYDANPQEFQTPGEGDDPQPVTQPYVEVEQRIKDRLIDQAVAEKMRSMTNMAYNALLEDMQGLSIEDNLRVLGEDFTPTPMAQIADRIERAFGLGPDYVRIDDRWLTADELEALDRIGAVSVFAPYVLSAVELRGTSEDAEQSQLPLQVGLTSTPFGDDDGNTYLFRLIDAQAAHPPDSIDQVRAQVRTDARRKAAYEKLLDERETWFETFRATTDFAALAAEPGVERLAGGETATFPRREAAVRVPEIEGLGADEQFVDAVFELADRLRTAGDMRTMPAAERRTIIPVDGQLTLALIEVRSFQGMTRAQYAQALADPQQKQYAALLVSSALRNTGVATTDPLSYDALVARLVDQDEEE